MSAQLTELQEQTTKRLAELKAYLEKKLEEHEQEVRTLRPLMETVDSLLAEKSYRKVEIPRSVIEAVAGGSRAGQPQSIRTMSGVHLADIYVERLGLRIVPSEKLRLDANAPPLRAFLVGKVLEPFRTGDEEAVGKRSLPPDQVLSYKIDQEAGRLKEITIQNYGDERRLNEIKNAVRWSLTKMYEKTIGT